MRNKKPVLIASAVILGVSAVALADQMILDDLIVQSSVCVGTDCVNGESFDYDTIRLKENNLQIHFDDTSTAGSFADNDWRLVANDSANGGANHFSIVDATAGRTLARFMAGAPSNSLYVNSQGLIGFGTSSPSQKLHASSNNTPAIRLQQTAAGGFAPQSWDVAGNEANFFVRDAVTNSLPFRIRPGAPQSSIFVAGEGRVGFGTDNPSAFLHVRRGESSGTDVATDGAVRVEMTPGSPSESLGLVVSNLGPITNAFLDEAGGDVWYEMIGRDLRTGVSAYEISEASTGVVGLRVESNGDVTIGGTLTEGSSRAIKHGIEDVDVDDLLQTVRSLSIHRWRYVSDPDQAEHLGPMAEDFHAAFGLGADPERIATLDTSGVALAAVQALTDKVATLELEREKLESENAALADRLARLERLVEGMATKAR